jgi:hypothetical protein
MEKAGKELSFVLRDKETKQRDLLEAEAFEKGMFMLPEF